MGNLHGCPTNIEHTGEKTIIKYFQIPGVTAQVTEQTILKNKKEAKHNQDKSSYVPLNYHKYHGFLAPNLVFVLSEK
jgi:hypothetical protein